MENNDVLSFLDPYWKEVHQRLNNLKQEKQVRDAAFEAAKERVEMMRLEIESLGDHINSLRERYEKAKADSKSAPKRRDRHKAARESSNLWPQIDVLTRRRMGRIADLIGANADLAAAAKEALDVDIQIDAVQQEIDEAYPACEETLTNQNQTGHEEESANPNQSGFEESIDPDQPGCEEESTDPNQPNRE